MFVCLMPSWYFKDTSTKQPKSASFFVLSTVSEEVVLSHSKSANAKNCVNDNPDRLIASPCCFFHSASFLKCLSPCKLDIPSRFPIQEKETFFADASFFLFSV